MLAPARLQENLVATSLLAHETTLPTNLIQFSTIFENNEANSNDSTTLSPYFAMITKLNPPFHKPFMMCAIFIVAPIAMALHMSIIYIIVSRPNKYKNVFYKIVVVISCTDIYWCNYYLYQNMCNLLGYGFFGDFGNMAISMGAQYTFFLCMNMDLLIAFNRFSAVVLCDHHERIFNKEKVVWYILGFMVASAVECTPTWIYKKKYFLEFQTLTFVEKPSPYMEKVIMWVELGCTYVAHSILAVLYVWSFTVYRRVIKNTTNIAKKKEGRLLYQAVFSGIPCFIMITFHYLVPVPMFEQLGGDWCLLNGPTVYLWFNSDIRADFWELIGVKKADNKYIMNTFVMMKRMGGMRENAVHDINQFKGEENMGLPSFAEEINSKQKGPSSGGTMSRSGNSS